MATCQLTRPAQAIDAQQVLAADITTKAQSTFFVKKFTALSISNICFLRNIFPDEAFADRKLDRVNLKILRVDNACEEARHTVKLLNSVFQCIDNGWIKSFDIGIYACSNIVPENLLEVWQFHYSSSQVGFSKEEHNGVQHLKFGFQRQIDTDVTRRELHQMIRTLRFDAQHMKTLPDDARMVFRIVHTDEAPTTLELNGFTTTDEPNKFRFVIEEAEHVQAAQPVKLKIGNVSTEFDAIKVRLTTRQSNLDYMIDSEHSLLLPSKLDHSGDVSRLDIELADQPMECGPDDFARVPNSLPSMPAGLPASGQRSPFIQTVPDLCKSAKWQQPSTVQTSSGTSTTHTGLYKNHSPSLPSSATPLPPSKKVYAAKKTAAKPKKIMTRKRGRAPSNVHGTSSPEQLAVAQALADMATYAISPKPSFRPTSVNKAEIKDLRTRRQDADTTATDVITSPLPLVSQAVNSAAASVQESVQQGAEISDVFELANSQESVVSQRKRRRTSVLRAPIKCFAPAP